MGKPLTATTHVNALRLLSVAGLYTELGVWVIVQRALTTNQQEKNRWFTFDSLCGYCFLSRSVEAKGMFCIFWMLVTLVMPTGCGLSIRRLRRSRRTWQPYRYISSHRTVNPTDSNVTSHREDNDVFQVRQCGRYIYGRRSRNGLHGKTPSNWELPLQPSNSDVGQTCLHTERLPRWPDEAILFDDKQNKSI